MNDHQQREDQPRNIHPNDAGRNEPGKETKAQHKIDINESESGREVSQTPGDENLDSGGFQIDPGTIRINDNNPVHKTAGSDDLLDETDFERGYRSEINSADNRDPEDSTTDWDAENNESGRHK